MLLYLENDRGRGIANLLQLLSYFLMFQMEINKTGNRDPNPHRLQTVLYAMWYSMSQKRGV